MSIAPASSISEPEGWPIKEVWEKYEEIAMHFNDLLIRLRTQALGGVAAISAIVSLFAKSQNIRLDWEMAIAMFSLLFVFWIAVWIIDFCYYNKLLAGAVIALVEIEELSKAQTHIQPIRLSTMIEATVVGTLPKAKPDAKILRDPRWFYGLVLLALGGGLIFSLCQFWNIPSPSTTGSVIEQIGRPLI